MNNYGMVHPAGHDIIIDRLNHCEGLLDLFMNILSSNLSNLKIRLHRAYFNHILIMDSS